MQSRIVLISNDSDFFEYIIPKLSLRKSDELYRFSFNNILEQIHILSSSLLIINSENCEQQTLDLLSLVKGIPSFVFNYNENSEFKVEVYKSGAYAYVTLMTSDEEFRARLIPALTMASELERGKFYRKILNKSHLVGDNNEVFFDYKNLIEEELKNNANSSNTVFMVIAPGDKSKFLLKPNQIETIILNNIRKNDLLMNFAPNKYFLFLYDVDLDKAQKIWEKIRKNIPEPVYAGFTMTLGKNREQLVNAALNKLHEAMNQDSYASSSLNQNVSGSNFKFFRQEFNNKLQKVIVPVFYQIQQIYNSKLYGVKIEQGIGEGYGVLYVKGKFAKGEFRITSPGFSKVNIDISYEPENSSDEKKHLYETKRISFEPEELEAGIVEDLLEQFIIEFKEEVNRGNS